MTRHEALAEAERVLADPNSTQADCTDARLALHPHWNLPDGRGEDAEVREAMHLLAQRRHAIRRGAVLSARLRRPLPFGGGDHAA